VALSGTLETFSLPDVLRLLSSTKKTGLLALDGDRGRGRVWVDGGEIVAADATRAVVDDVDAVLFELLRFGEASFEFDTTAELPDGAGAPRAVDDALDVAETRLAEWQEIEAVVPSLDVRVRMVPELDGDATVTPADWRVLARIGTGASGHDLAGHLVQGEYDVCRQLRDLVEAGLVELTGEVEEAPAAPPATEEVAGALEAMLHAPVPETPVFEVPVAEPQPEVAAAVEDVVAAWTAEEPAAESAAVAEAAPFADLVPEPDVDDVQPSAFAAAEAELRRDVADDADLLSDLAHLSPRAAAAVEATWAAEAPEPAEPEAGEAKKDDLDQNLLLRFLSSSKP